MIFTVRARLLGATFVEHPRRDRKITEPPLGRPRCLASQIDHRPGSLNHPPHYSPLTASQPLAVDGRRPPYFRRRFACTRAPTFRRRSLSAMKPVASLWL